MTREAIETTERYDWLRHRANIYLAGFLVVGGVILLCILMLATYQIASDNARQIADVRNSSIENYKLILELKTQNSLVRDLRRQMIDNAGAMRAELDSMHQQARELRGHVEAIEKELLQLKAAGRD